MKYVFEDTNESIIALNEALEKKYLLDPVLIVDYSAKPPVCKCNTDKGFVILNVGDSIEV